MAAAKKSPFIKLGKFRSPFGTAFYPRLDEPDFEFKDAGEYRVTIRLNPEDVEDVREQLQALFDEGIKKLKEIGCKAHPALNGLPIKEEIDRETEKPTGAYLLSASMIASGKNKKTDETWEKRPVIVDSQKQKVTEKVWGGSDLRFSAMVGTYNPNKKIGYGIKLYLEAVQVRELVTGSDGTEAFDTFDGFQSGGGTEGESEVVGADTGDATEF